MQKLFQFIFILITIISYSQEKEVVKFRGNLSNYNNNHCKSLTVIDKREDPQIGILPFGENQEMREVVFPTTISNDLEQRYKSGINEGGSYELILVLKKLKLKSGKSDGKETVGSVEFSGQTFLKNGNNYQFIHKKDTILYFKDKKISEVLVKNISTVFEYLFSKTYNKKPLEFDMKLNDINDYEFYIKSQYSIFNSQTLKDGIYLDYISFFKQAPVTGNFVLERNKKGEVTKAIINGKDKISPYDMFAYVENGKPFKQTFSGFMELSRNEKGFYLISNKWYLFPQESNNSYGMYGLIGATVGIIVENSKQKKFKKDQKQEVYIDWLTGDYNFQD